VHLRFSEGDEVKYLVAKVHHSLERMFIRGVLTYKVHVSVQNKWRRVSVLRRMKSVLESLGWRLVRVNYSSSIIQLGGPPGHLPFNISKTTKRSRTASRGGEKIASY
jgi:hypothetical protein